MRLINCTTRLLEEPPDASIPPYAILSHRWDPDKEQVTYQDFLAGQAASPHKYWAKIWGSCKVALREGFGYVWIDTCCFDKSSSSEMSETINSMFRWYTDAKVCITYLSDFDSQKPDSISNLGASGWFYRGWTLQELIAPPRVQFYDCNWVYFGTRSELAPQISTVTGIDEDMLRSENPGGSLPHVTVAKRMSWAARRKTTRLEDRAYSLLGIFGVNMPMLYGEGERAFIRLQEEILKESSDLTLFAWRTAPLYSENGGRCRGILARSPSEFAEAGHLVHRQNAISNPEYMLTNKGLRIEIVLQKNGEQEGFLSLNCVDQRSGKSESLGIFLKHRHNNIYVRRSPQILAPLSRMYHLSIPAPGAYITKDIDILESDLPKSFERSVSSSGFRSTKFDIEHTPAKHFPFKSFTVGFPKESWSQETSSFNTQGYTSFIGLVHLKFWRSSPYAIVVCGFNADVEPWVCVTTPGDDVYSAAREDDIPRLARICNKHTTSTNVCKFPNPRVGDYGVSTLFDLHTSLSIFRHPNRDVKKQDIIIKVRQEVINVEREEENQQKRLNTRKGGCTIM